MGIIGEGRSAIAKSEEQHAQALSQERADQVSAIMGNLSVTLAEPEFTGDIETALVHYMGEGAFYDDETTNPYTNLAKRIEDEAAKDKRVGVPVLFVYQDLDEVGEEGAPSTVFMKVPRGEVRFKSATTVDEDVPVNAYTGQLVKDEETGREEWKSTSANITHKHLSLVANTVVVGGDIFDAGERLGATHDLVIADGFAFSESHFADGGHGRGMPTSHSFTNFSVDRLESEPTLLVGWKEIEDNLTQRLAGGGAKFEKALSLHKFFGHIGELGSIQERAPRISEVLESAASFQKVA